MTAFLNGSAVSSINADLTAGGNDLTSAQRLTENINTVFEGTKKYGDFDIAGELARQWLACPNPHGKSNSHVVKPWSNGQDVARRASDTWIIDFGTDTDESEASLFEQPFQHVAEKVKPSRKDKKWWLHERPRPEMRIALRGLCRFIVTPRVAKHRFFVWLDKTVLPDTRLGVVARADDTTFGILSSRQHEVWSLANASMHGVGNDPTYNAKSCFETFPFPAGLTPRDTAPAASQTSPPCLVEQIIAGNIGAAARQLNTLRENWLNPPEWVDWVITPEEEKAGFPKRPVVKPGHEVELKKRTLTNLYNAKLAGKAAWLDNAHKALDAAVAAAYGWTDYAPKEAPLGGTPAMPDEEILRRLLALNLERAGDPHPKGALHFLRSTSCGAHQ